MWRSDQTFSEVLLNIYSNRGKQFSLGAPVRYSEIDSVIAKINAQIDAEREISLIRKEEIRSLSRSLTENGFNEGDLLDLLAHKELRNETLRSLMLRLESVIGEESIVKGKFDLIEDLAFAKEKEIAKPGKIVNAGGCSHKLCYHEACNKSRECFTIFVTEVFYTSDVLSHNKVISGIILSSSGDTDHMTDIVFVKTSCRALSISNKVL